jgi:hypothetical protein
MTNDESKIRPTIVTGATQAKQAGELRDRWWWIEHSVWTDLMLTRLEQSEPTTVWFGQRWPNRWFARQGLFSLEHGSCIYG